MSQSSEPCEAPLLDADRLVGWLYAADTKIQVAVEGYRYVDLPAPQQFAELLAVAQDQGYEWVLMDGPRAMRRSWVLDPWWSDRPELSAKMLKDTRAGCLASAQLQQALQTAASASR